MNLPGINNSDAGRPGDGLSSAAVITGWCNLIQLEPVPQADARVNGRDDSFVNGDKAANIHRYLISLWRTTSGVTHALDRLPVLKLTM